MQFPDRQTGNDVPTSVQKKVFEIEANAHISRSDIDAKFVITAALQMKLTNRYRTQKWSINFIYAGSQPLLAGDPPHPQANAIRNRQWRRYDCPQRKHQNE